MPLFCEMRLKYLDSPFPLGTLECWDYEWHLRRVPSKGSWTTEGQDSLLCKEGPPFLNHKRNYYSLYTSYIFLLARTRKKVKQLKSHTQETIVSNSMYSIEYMQTEYTAFPLEQPFFLE